MSKGYKLADGSLSTDYEIGDEFVSTKSHGCVRMGDALTITENTNNDDALANFKHVNYFVTWTWGDLIPAPETKRKVQARRLRKAIENSPKIKVSTGFFINSGDYIDSREFSREECERFCELAVECGFERGEWMDNYRDSFHGYYLQIYRDELFWCAGVDSGVYNATNITTQFREFLDKEKGMNQFTKDDLKDGMRVTPRKGETGYVCWPYILFHQSDLRLYISSINNDLTSAVNDKNSDIVKVTDRDGTVLFEREPELKEVTLKLTQEQIDSLKEQGIS